jgi:hypothetical protein
MADHQHDPRVLPFIAKARRKAPKGVRGPMLYPSSGNLALAPAAAPGTSPAPSLKPMHATS